MKRLILPILLALSATLFAQEEVQFDNGCNFNSTKTSGTYTLFEPTEAAGNLVDKILDQAGITTRPFTLQAANVDNAQAAMRQSQRYLLYSNVFIKDLSTDAKTNWASYCVFAHEIGHHVLGHNLEEQDPKVRRKMELGADEFAAVAMARAGATEDEALSGLRLLDPEVSSEFYPPVSAREEAMSIAFAKELARRSKEAAGKEGGARTFLALDDASFNRWNILEKEKVSAEIADEKVTINFNISPDYAFRPLNIVLCTTNPDIQIKTLTGTGSTTFDKSGAASVTWNYQMDQVPRALASQPGKLRLFVYDQSRLPSTKMRIGSKIGFAGMVAAGVGVGVIGLLQRKDAVELHDMYKTQRNELDPVYAQESREELYDRANKKFVSSQLIMAGGGVLIAGGVVWLWREIKKTKEARQAICDASPRGRLQCEPLLAMTNGVMEYGISIRF